MARFRAYTSDTSSSSEEEEEEEKVAERLPSETRRAQPQADAEESDGEESEASSSSGSSSSSEMREDELLESPPRQRGKSRQSNRNALVEDENGDIHYAHEVRIRVSSTSSTSRSPPTRTQNAAGRDPTIIPWAQQIGVDAQKMHVMQASLFRMPEEAAALKALNQAPKTGAGTLNARLGISGKQSVNRKHSRDSEGDGLRLDARERASFAHDVEPPIFRPSRKYTRVEVASSIANEHEAAYYDAGLAMGRSFRVGWGPGGRLVHLGSICGPMSKPKPTTSSSVVSISKAITSSSFSNDPSPSASFSPSSLAAKLLQHHLSHTTIARDDEGIPAAYPSSHSLAPPSPSSVSSRRTLTHAAASSPGPLNFASFTSLFPTTDISSPAPIFRLGRALFDPIDLHFGRPRSNNPAYSSSAVTPDVKNRIQILRRKAALSRWLEEVVKPSLEGDLRVQINGSGSTTYTPADAAFTHLTGHQISASAAAAAEGGYLKLSTLISQAGGDDFFKGDILEQLEIWKSEKLSPGSNVDLGSKGLVNRGVWRVYHLLGGLVDQDESDNVNGTYVWAGLDWKRVFGLCLWYGTSVDAAVADVVAAYERILLQSSKSLPSHVARPIPKWALNQQKKSTQPIALGAPTSRLGLFLDPNSSDSPDDPLYALIKLHADPALSLSKALNPLSFGPSGSDLGIGMCWHLYVILSRVMRVRDFADRADPGVFSQGTRKAHGALINGFGGEESSDDGDNQDPPQEGHSPTADLLTSSYASQLESWGMVQEAAFVLMHLEGGVGREKAIKDLLARSGPKIDDWVERGLVGSLKLPVTWIEEAKALNALDNGNIFSAYELYISAQSYNAAHNLAVLELAPDAIIRKDLELLRVLFNRFDADGKRDKIDGWFVRGQIFLDFVDIMTHLPPLLDHVTTENQEGEVMVDAAQADAIDELSRRIPKVIGLLPDILHRNLATDRRHPAALEEMTKDLLKLLERSKPLLLNQIHQPTLNVLDGATKINLVGGVGLARFLQSIEA